MDPRGYDTVLNLDCIHILAMTSYYSVARCYYWRTVGKGTYNYVLFLTTAYRHKIISKQKV